ncbi:MAG: tetratricopeptide repeat protein [Bryobacteraceae bacterium]
MNHTLISRTLTLLWFGIGGWLWAVPASQSANETLTAIQERIQARDLPAARRDLEAAVRSFPNEPAVFNLFGVVEAQEGNYGAAEKAFRRSIQLAPRATSAYLNLGRLYQENAAKDPAALDKGIKTYEAVLKFEPGNVEAVYQGAVLSQRKGSYRASLQYLQRLPEEDRLRPQALAVLCADHAGLGDQARAADAAHRLLETPDLSELDVLDILPSLAASKRTELAIELLVGLRKRKLASPDAVRQLGLLYEKHEQWNDARAALEEAGQAKSFDVPSLLELARIAYRQRDLEGALGYLAHARDLDSKIPAIHFFFGIISMELDLPIDARKSLEQAVKLEPENPWYNYAAGAAISQDRIPAEAIPYFQKYCTLRPDDPRGRFGLGVAHFYAKEFEDAQRELTKISDRPETSSGAHYFLGRIALMNDDVETATQDLMSAVKANSNYADAWATLGQLYTRQKKYEEARKALDRAVALDPDGYLTNMNLLAFYQRTKDPRAAQQKQRFEQIQQKRAIKEKMLLRTIEARPYEAPAQ